MGYKVIHFFNDLQDFNHAYHVGDVYPRMGVRVSDARIAELASSKNKQGKPLIDWVGDKEKDFVITIHLADEKMLGWMFNGPIPARYMKIVRNFKKKNFYKIQKNYCS